MSSTQSHHQTFWCHECDMSIHLLTSAAATGGDPLPPPLCPHCHSDNIEQMDEPTLNPTTTTTTDSNSFFLDSPSFRRFFLPFFGDFSGSDDDDDTDTLFDSIIPTIKITSTLLEGIEEDDPELVCAICKDHFVIDVDAKLLPCNHLFHPQCILPWLNSNHNTCPLCRFQLPPPSKRHISIIPATESSSNFSFPQLTDSDCTRNFSNVGVQIGFTHQDAVDCGFPDIGVLSNFLPSHF